MIDFGITAIWCDTPSDFRSEFKREFNDRTDDDQRDGLHTFVFSTYHDNSAYTEVIYCLIKNDIVLFFHDSIQYELILDNSFTVTGVRTVDNNSFIFVNSVFATGDVHYIGDSCDYNGILYNIFTVQSDRMLSDIMKKYRVVDGFSFPMEDIIRLSDEEIMNCTLNFMEMKSKSFADQINMAKLDGEPYEGIEENPFQDRFFDDGIVE